jgi:hypothetical protein
MRGIPNDNAVNDACWTMVEQLPGPIPAHIWNNLKLPLKAAIETWLEKRTPWNPTDEELTRIYKEANGETDGKAKPITTERIFAAMRAMLTQERI